MESAFYSKKFWTRSFSSMFVVSERFSSLVRWREMSALVPIRSASDYAILQKYLMHRVVTRVIDGMSSSGCSAGAMLLSECMVPLQYEHSFSTVYFCFDCAQNIPSVATFFSRDFPVHETAWRCVEIVAFARFLQDHARKEMDK